MFNAHFVMMMQVLLAFLLGGITGVERQFHRSSAGIRTYAAVAMGACVFGLISTHPQGTAYYHSVADPTRIAAQIVSGMGFIGAGVIFREGPKTNGLTTAATLWTTAAIGLAVSFSLYVIAVTTTLLLVLLLSLQDIHKWTRVLRGSKNLKK